MNIIDNIFYVYLYLNPLKPANLTCYGTTLKFEPFYVGKGANKRMTAHLGEVHRGRCAVAGFLEICSELKSQGQIPISLVIRKGLSHAQALRVESGLIRKYKRLDIPILNKIPLGKHNESVSFKRKFISEAALRQLSCR